MIYPFLETNILLSLLSDCHPIKKTSSNYCNTLHFYALKCLLKVFDFRRVTKTALIFLKKVYFKFHFSL